MADLATPTIDAVGDVVESPPLVLLIPPSFDGAGDVSEGGDGSLVLLTAPTVDAAGVVSEVELTPALFLVGGLAAYGDATLAAPPPVALPAPPFASWDEATTYARHAFVRLRYLTSQVPANEAAVGEAQIVLAGTLEELRLLQVAATELLAQGVNLA